VAREPIVNDYFGTVPSGTVESLLSVTRRYLLLFNSSLLFAHHYGIVHQIHMLQLAQLLTPVIALQKIIA